MDTKNKSSRLKSRSVFWIVCAFLLVVTAIGAVIFQQANQTEQRRNACNVLYQNVKDLNMWSKDWQARSDQVTVDDKTMSLAVFAKNVTNLEVVRSLSTERYEKYKNLLDVYKKYLDLFTTYDMSPIYQSYQKEYEIYDQEYKVLIAFYQAVPNMKSANDMQSYLNSYNDAIKGEDQAQKAGDAADGTLKDLSQLVSVRCYDWFKIDFNQAVISK